MCPSSPIQIATGFIDTRTQHSLAIPMPESHVRRTNSEVRLYRETTEANYKDQLMFNRLVRGTHHRQRQYNEHKVSRDEFEPSRVRIPFLPAASECIEHSSISTSARNHPARFLQGLEKITPASPKDLQTFQQIDPSQELENWAIEGFEAAIPSIQDFSSSETEFVSCTYDSDEFSYHDDEVFDFDL